MLLDSNIIIYASLPQYENLREFIERTETWVSIVSRIEALGYHALSGPARAILDAYFHNANLIALTDEIADLAVSLRQQRRIKLGDSIVAATALLHDLTLVTHNTKDFQWIENLHVLDPLAGP